MLVGFEMKMKLLVLIIIIVAWNGVLAQYKSMKLARDEHVFGSNIQTGTFLTRVDHFRPQDPRTVEMVSGISPSPFIFNEI